MKVAAVLIDHTTKSFDKIYYYEVPSYLLPKLATGVRVNVPFGRGNSIRLAYFLDMVEYDDDKSYQMKKILNIIDEESVISKEQIKLAKMIRDRYFCTYSQAMNLMIPSGAKVKKEKYVMVDSKKVKLKAFLKEHINADLSKMTVIEEQHKVVNSKFQKSVRLSIDEPLALELLENFELSNDKQVKLVELLLEYDDMTLSDLKNYESISRSSVNTLAKKGFVEIFDKEIKRNPLVFHDAETFVPEALSKEQIQALSVIDHSLHQNEYQRRLIKGVTGSGKTEVYLHAAKKVIAKGKKVIVLVPEISLTPMMIRRFIGRFGDKVAVIHSRLSVLERYEQWKKIKDGQADIALGARSCVFAPFSNLGLIIIDEEHETSYKSETMPKYSALTVADMRCQLNHSLLLLGSATPSLTSYELFKKEDAIIYMSERVSKKALPGVSIVDMREEIKSGNTSIFSRQLTEEMNKNIKNKEQTLLFINRRGYQSFFLCSDCGEVVKCDHCDISMTYHKNRNSLICHHCGLIKKVPSVCPSCNSRMIDSFGLGTQKIEEYVKETFKDASVLRMDLDTTGFKHSHMALLDRFKNENIDILIGTQMIAKGHDFPNITLVGILAADTLTKGFSIYSEERAFQLITQSVGRAGRGDKKGRAIIQSYDVDNHAITFGVSQDYEKFYEYESTIRKQLSYPPYGIIGSIVISSDREKEVEYWTRYGENLLRKMGMDVSYSAKAPVYKIKNKYRYRIVVKGYNKDVIVKNLKGFYQYIYGKLPQNVKCSIDIDGIDMI